MYKKTINTITLLITILLLFCSMELVYAKKKPKVKKDEGECSRNSDCGSGEVCKSKECFPKCDNFWEDPSSDCEPFQFLIWIGVAFGAIIALSLIPKK